MGFFISVVFITSIILGQLSGNHFTKEARQEYKKNQIKIELRNEKKKRVG